MRTLTLYVVRQDIEDRPEDLVYILGPSGLEEKIYAYGKLWSQKEWENLPDLIDLLRERGLKNLIEVEPKIVEL